MTNIIREQVDRFPIWLKVFLILAIIAGVCFRLYDIDGKYFWGDEVYTLLYTAGFTEQELINEIADRELEVGYLNKFIFTNSEKGVLDTIKAISIDETQHPPLYYIFSHTWLKTFGNSIWVIRSFSVLLSFFTLAGIYWLGRELFKSKDIALTALTLAAVSPFHLIYAQEARLYSMWMLTTVLSSAVLLRALSRGTKAWWFIYGLSILIGIYTFTLFALVIASHGVYILSLSLKDIRFKPFSAPRKLYAYIISTACALGLFIPWAYLILKNLSTARQNLDWMQYDIGLVQLVKLWGFNISSAFVDIGLVPKINLPVELPEKSIEFMRSPHLDGLIESFRLFPIIYFSIKAAVILLVLYSIYFILKKCQRRSSFFLTSLIIIPFLAITLPDVVFGKVGSTLVGYRFFAPVIIGAELALAYLLVTKISLSGKWAKQMWIALTLLILIAGIGSCLTYFQADTWWTLRYGYHVKRIAPIINNSENPVVITHFESQTLAFPHNLDPDVRLYILKNIENFIAPIDRDNIFIYDLPSDMRKKLEEVSGLRIEEISEKDALWRMVITKD